MNVLLIEDDPLVMLGAQQALELAGIPVQPAASAELAFQHVASGSPAVVLTDVRLPDEDGFEVLKRMQALDAEVPVILMTGHGDIRMAVDAMRLGAYDFLEKPFSSERLVEVIRRALEKERPDARVHERRPVRPHQRRRRSLPRTGIRAADGAEIPGRCERTGGRDLPDVGSDRRARDLPRALRQGNAGPRAP